MNMNQNVPFPIFHGQNYNFCRRHPSQPPWLDLPLPKNHNLATRTCSYCLHLGYCLPPVSPMFERYRLYTYTYLFTTYLGRIVRPTKWSASFDLTAGDSGRLSRPSFLLMYTIIYIVILTYLNNKNVYQSNRLTAVNCIHTNTLLCFSDLDLDPLTLVYELDHFSHIYRNQVSWSRLSKVKAQTGQTDTDRQTDATEL